MEYWCTDVEKTIQKVSQKKTCKPAKEATKGHCADMMSWIIYCRNLAKKIT